MKNPLQYITYSGTGILSSSDFPSAIVAFAMPFLVSLSLSSLCTDVFSNSSSV